MDYSIDLSARVGPAAADPAAGTIGAAFTIDAPDAGTALEEGRRLFESPWTSSA